MVTKLGHSPAAWSRYSDHIWLQRGCVVKSGSGQQPNPATCDKFWPSVDHHWQWGQGRLDLTAPNDGLGWGWVLLLLSSSNLNRHCYRAIHIKMWCRRGFLSSYIYIIWKNTGIKEVGWWITNSSLRGTHARMCVCVCLSPYCRWSIVTTNSNINRNLITRDSISCSLDVKIFLPLNQPKPFDYKDKLNLKIIIIIIIIGATGQTWSCSHQIWRSD